jgi:hypothetical protein
MTNVSSSAELGNRGFDPSHFNNVPSSSGKGWNVITDVTTDKFVDCTTLYTANEPDRESADTKILF